LSSNLTQAPIRTPGELATCGHGVGLQVLDPATKPLQSAVGDSVVTTQPAVDDLLAVDHQRTLPDEPVQRRVQGPRAQLDPTVRELLDGLEDPIAVERPWGHRRQD
jgi:hypothetical protein